MYLTYSEIEDAYEHTETMADAVQEAKTMLLRRAEDDGCVLEDCVDIYKRIGTVTGTISMDIHLTTEEDKNDDLETEQKQPEDDSDIQEHNVLQLVPKSTPIDEPA